jgi:hypothetical protein
MPARSTRVGIFIPGARHAQAAVFGIPMDTRPPSL